MQKVLYEDLGLIDYKEAWDYQEALFNKAVSAKLGNRGLSESEQVPVNHHLIFCEHPHVYTLGKSGADTNLLVTSEELKIKNADFYKINRGGDITYHGPGQIVGYPIFDLDKFFTDIHKYLRFLEEAIIRTLADYNIQAGRVKDYTGVWLDESIPHKARKICAMGVRCSRWVTMHGFAFNVSPDLDYFQNIVPCGITDRQVTSLERELGYKPDMEEVKSRVLKHICELFSIELMEYEKKA